MRRKFSRSGKMTLTARRQITCVSRTHLSAFGWISTVKARLQVVEVVVSDACQPIAQDYCRHPFLARQIHPFPASFLIIHSLACSSDCENHHGEGIVDDGPSMVCDPAQRSMKYIWQVSAHMNASSTIPAARQSVTSSRSLDLVHIPSIATPLTFTFPA